MFQREIRSSIAYLTSSEAIASLARDSYWPKWHSPWWHMLVLHEMGESARIPLPAVDALVSALASFPLQTFLIQSSDLPQGMDPWRHASCHCAVGNVYQILSACGVKVDERVPWLRPWMLGYQMADGGMNCDNEAYLIKDECASSMVGTIPPFEAVLLHTPRSWSDEETIFLDRCAAFLIERKLVDGSASTHNREEREQAKAWTKLCFPRFYFYDVLRGLSVLLEWSERRSKSIPWSAIEKTVMQLEKSALAERLSFSASTTLQPSASGDWMRGQPTTSFPLLIALSELGRSPFLEKQWKEASARLVRLRARRLIV